MLNDFLKHFGKPLIVALPDIDRSLLTKEVKSKVKRDIRKSTEVLMELNAQYPFGLFFTPNGNYSDIALMGESIKGKRTNDNHGEKPYWHCLAVDIDRCNKKKPTSFKNNEELRDHVKGVIKSYVIPPTFVVETPGGFHLYRCFRDEDKQEIQETIGDKTVEISEFIANLFEGGDPSSYSVSKLMRLPESKHRKTREPLDVKLFQYIDGELSDKYDASKILYINTRQLQKALDYIKGFKKETKVVQKIRENIDSKQYIDINKIPFVGLIEKLENYPKIYVGEKYTFFTEGDRIHIKLEDGTVKRTDGYTIKRGDNYVNCFSDHYHDIQERPRGPVIAFLYHYFDKDYKKLEYFLKTEYGISLAQLNEHSDGEEIRLEIKKYEYSVIFTNKRVQLQKVVERKDGSQSMTTKNIFNVPIKIIGKSKIAMNENFTENEQESLVSLFEVNGNSVVVKRHPTKTKFNTVTKELFFYGDDNELGLFYEALEYSSDIPMMDCISLSGFYDDFVYLGGKCIFGETNKFQLPLYIFSTDRKIQIPIKEYFEKLEGLYSDYIGVTAGLQAIALAGMNLWQDQTIYPSLLLTGFTTSGKSTLGRMLKGMLGYGRDARQYALPSLSAQPLKQHASDYSILFLEEITSDVQEKCEDLLRNVINRDRGARGFSSTNVYYNLRSPLLVMGERTFKDESINNRFVTIVMDNVNQVGDRDKVESIIQYSASDEIYTKYFAVKDKLAPIYKKYVKYLQDANINNRYADIRAYIFVVNELFEIGYDNLKLVDFMKKNLKNLGIKEKTIQVSIDHQLKSILVEAILKKSLIGTVVEESVRTRYEITLMPEYYQKHRAVLNLLCNKFNDMGSNMCIEGGIFTVTVNTTSAGGIDFVLDVLFNFLTKVGKHVFTYV